MFQKLIVAASAIIKDVKVISTLEIGKNCMTTNWLTGNSLNSTSLPKRLNLPTHLPFNLSSSISLSVYK